MQQPKLLAFAGLARSGKDTLAAPLVKAGFVSIAFSSVIKDFFDPFTKGEEAIPDLRRRMQQVNPNLDITDWTDFYKRVLEPFDDLNITVSAFTEDDALKQQIRPTLERGGELIYDYVMREYFRCVDAAWSAGKSVVNTRLVKEREAREWKKRGGEIILVTRRDWPAATPWEAENVMTLYRSGLIDAEVFNEGSAEDWEAFAVNFARAMTQQAVSA